MLREAAANNNPAHLGERVNAPVFKQTDIGGRWGAGFVCWNCSSLASLGSGWRALQSKMEPWGLVVFSQNLQIWHTEPLNFWFWLKTGAIVFLMPHGTDQLGVNVPRHVCSSTGPTMLCCHERITDEGSVLPPTTTHCHLNGCDLSHFTWRELCHYNIQPQWLTGLSDHFPISSCCHSHRKQLLTSPGNRSQVQRHGDWSSRPLSCRFGSSVQGHNAKLLNSFLCLPPRVCVTDDKSGKLYRKRAESED